MMRRLVVLTSLVAAGLGGPMARACASCGAGGDDPLILYPNERLKIFTGFAQTAGFRNVDPDGTQSTAGGPSVKETFTFAAGYGISNRAFVTMTAPYMRNTLDGESKASMGDPSIAARYAPVLQSMATPLVPQVQLIAGYKQAQARSLRESEEMKTLLDVFGSGFSEAKAGVDVWYGMTSVKVGAAHVVAKPQERDFDGIAYEPGLIQRSTVSAGYLWNQHVKTTAGVSRETRGRLKVDGDEEADSDQLNHSAFATADWMLSQIDTVRLTYARQAVALDNRNTTASRSVSMAYMRTF